MITPQTIQQIQNRIDVVDVVGSFVKLKRRGTNYLGLCPFHNEKTPSFTVSPAKEIYKCFGCGKSGNSISFLMEHEKYSYVEALRWLAARYNIEVEETEVSPEVRQQQQVADSLYIINGFAQKYFSDILFNAEEGQNVGLSYLEERGFSEETIRKFQLGYCLQERDAFARKALESQYNLEYLQKSGLVVVRDERPVDNYRGRIIFPVHNQTGKVIGFGARIIAKNDRAPKYINTPENELYIKSRILYGSYFARQAIDKQDECLLVEGYTDVISLHQAGIENVVASGGTSLTIDQLRLIKKYTDNLTIIYDGDGAGIKAALRGLDMALEESLNVKLVLIPDKEDPDSYVNKVGADHFREFVKENKKDFIFFQLEVSLQDAGEDSNKKAAIVNQVAETISKINKAEDFTRQQDYIRRCSQILSIDETGLNNLVNKFIRDKIAKQESKLPAEEAKFFEENARVGEESNFEDNVFNLLHKDEMQEKALLKALLEFGHHIMDEQGKMYDYIFREFSEIPDLFENPGNQKIYNVYKHIALSLKVPEMNDFIYHNDVEVSSLTIAITSFPYELSKAWEQDIKSDAIFKDEVKRIPDYKSFREFAEGKDGNINARIFKDEIDDFEKKYVLDTVRYLKLRKIKKMIEENQRDMQRPHSNDELMILIQTHQHLKEIELLTLKQGETVYLGK